MSCSLNLLNDCSGSSPYCSCPRYGGLVNTNSRYKQEKLYRNDYKYDYFLPIKYNWKDIKIGRGSAIFIHLTKNYKPTAGCIGLSEKDFLILIKLINKNTKIKIL